MIIAHEASASTASYLYQCRYALLKRLKVSVSSITCFLHNMFFYAKRISQWVVQCYVTFTNFLSLRMLSGVVRYRENQRTTS